MSVTRHFLGWDAPLTARVSEYLIPSPVSGPVDLGGMLIAVPTRQASRRLRQTLACRCAENNTALLSPQVVTPSYFLKPKAGTYSVAGPSQLMAVWAKVLQDYDLSSCRALFPAGIQRQDFSWAMQTGEMLQNLRNTLVEAGLDIREVLNQYGSTLEELDRWRNLADLEKKFTTELEKLKIMDPCLCKIQRTKDSLLPEKTNRIVIAAVPDPAPLVLSVLKIYSEKIPVDILIHAPESQADAFDEWGIPIPEYWAEKKIDIPDPEKNVLLAGSPEGQSRVVQHLIASEADRYSPAELAVGVADADIIAPLLSDFKDKGLRAQDPAGISLKDHPVWHLLAGLRALLVDDSYESVSSLLSHADVLCFLEHEHDLSAAVLLSQRDAFFHHHLPSSFSSVKDRLFGGHQHNRLVVDQLTAAVHMFSEWLDSIKSDGDGPALLQILQNIYIDADVPSEDLLISTSEHLLAFLAEVKFLGENGFSLTNEEQLDLMLQALGGQTCFEEQRESVLDLEGWLELPWNDAPFLIVSGMNEGKVPDSRMGDIFLPDPLRRQLGLRHEAGRYARDAFLMTAMIESRRTTGRVCFIVGKNSQAGDPLKPSRFLFRCSPEELPKRVELLLGEIRDARVNVARKISFPLKVTPPPDLSEDRLKTEQLHVTRFKDYLACPFRFYLKHVLKMETCDDRQREMDPGQFGSLVHYALQKMAEDTNISASDQPSEIRDYLWWQLDLAVDGIYGQEIPLQLRVQVDSARARLEAAAQVQAELIQEGWRIAESEIRKQCEINGMTVVGTIDRVDIHEATGRWRILDYKTIDKGNPPDSTHLRTIQDQTRDYNSVQIGKNKVKAWKDLQLPLYQRLFLEDHAGPANIELGYFVLPRVPGKTAVLPWDGFDKDIYDSALTCTEGIIADIQANRFWPPAPRVEYDDFGELFSADISSCVDVDGFEAFMNEVQK